jgi:hypothetical protein
MTTMAKSEYVVHGKFDDVVANITQGVLDGSSSASLVDGSDIVVGKVRCAVRVFERFSWDAYRVSMNVTMVSNGDAVHLSAITAGGSQGFIKYSSIGEKRFLGTLDAVVDSMPNSTRS